MKDSDQIIDRLTERLHRLESAIADDLLIAKLGELSRDEISSFTSQQAADYLRSVDDKKIGFAFQLLSKKIDSATLTELCIEFLRNPGNKTRRVGTFGLGSCLKGTGSKEASHLLALIVHNSAEDAETRLGAYLSLVLINKDAWMDLKRIGFTPDDKEPQLENVDWQFVNRFR